VHTRSGEQSSNRDEGAAILLRGRASMAMSVRTRAPLAGSEVNDCKVTRK
jgi:hypothetical protein